MIFCHFFSAGDWINPSGQNSHQSRLRGKNQTWNYHPVITLYSLQSITNKKKESRASVMTFWQTNRNDSIQKWRFTQWRWFTQRRNVPLKKSNHTKRKTPETSLGMRSIFADKMKLHKWRFIRHEDILTRKTNLSPAKSMVGRWAFLSKRSFFGGI